jgi:hypothetical protein
VLFSPSVRRQRCSQVGQDVLRQDALVLRYAPRVILTKPAQKLTPFSGRTLDVLAPLHLRAVFENVVLATYHCRYDWQDRKVKDIRGEVLYQTWFASPQGSLIPLTLHDSTVVYRARSSRHRVPPRSPTQQLLLFEVVHTR